MAGTFKARGAGGVEFVFDDLVPGTERAEIMANQVRRGELLLLNDDGSDMTPSVVEKFVEAATGVPAPRDDRRSPASAAPEPGPETGGEPSDPSVVPDGSIPVVIDWVRGAPEGDDPTEGWAERAAVALAAEQDAEKPRTSLIEKLEDIVASAAPEPGPETGGEPSDPSVVPEV